VTSFDSELILARLQGLHPKAIDLSLGRIERLLAALGHPERRLAPAVHIAGTNGKGSTLAMLDFMLQAAGRRVQRYVSPHLVRFNERILFDARPIAEAELADALDLCERVNAGAPITFFEITTAAAFVAFARRAADVLLLETGLGGRLDATNVIERPCLTALTPIALDHQGFLGERL
jgi:dihydrofolate synthase/folylpolyglutamate synthase